MASELQVDYLSGKVVYFQVRNSVGQIYNTAGAAFEAYSTANIADYDIAGTEQGTASAFYTGNMPSVAAGIYSIVAKERIGGSPAESDISIGWGNLEWGGTVVTGLGTPYGEPTGAPPLSASLLDKIGYLYMVLRNQLTITASAKTFFDDGGAAEWSKALTDDGTTYTEAEGS